jgi:hypothetical protein
MDAHLDAILAAFVRLKEPEPADMVSFLQRLPEPGVLSSPWYCRTGFPPPAPSGWTKYGHEWSDEAENLFR